MAMYIYINEDRDINIVYKNGRNKALPLTGASVEVVIAAAATSATPLLTKTTSTYLTPSGTSLPLDTTGVATVTLSDTEVDTLGAGSFVMDAKVRDNAGHDSVSQTQELVIKARRS